MFIQENAFKDVVCKMAAILSRPQYVKFIHINPKRNQNWEDVMPQTPDIFSLVDAAWKHPKLIPMFLHIAARVWVNIDIHKHENSSMFKPQ